MRLLISLACPHAGHTHLCVLALLLSLHDESRQRRAKGRRKPFGAVSFSPWNPSSFDRSRFASVAKAPGAYVFVCVKTVPAQLGQLQFEALTARESV